MIYFNINSPVHVLVGKHCDIADGRRTKSTGTLPSRKGYSNQKVHPGSSPGVATSSLQMKYLFSRSRAVCEDSPVFLETH